MPTYEIQNPATGKWHDVEFDRDPSNEDLDFMANHLATNVDTGQGVFTSALSAAARGATSVVGDIPGGLGALGEVVGLDNNVLTRTGDAIDQWAVDTFPVNPAHEDNLIVEGAGVLGQATAQMATIPIGGVAGRGIAAARGLSAAATKAAGVNAARGLALGTGFGAGADAGVDAANRLGLENRIQRAATILGYAGIEGGTEMLGGFGSREFTEGVMSRLPSFLTERGGMAAARSILSEGAEELLVGVGQPSVELGVLMGQDAPSGEARSELPWESTDAFVDWVKQGAFGSLAGGYMHALGAVTRGSPDANEAVQWRIAANMRMLELQEMGNRTPEQERELNELDAKDREAAEWLENSGKQIDERLAEILDTNSEWRNRESIRIADIENDAERQLATADYNNTIRLAAEMSQDRVAAGTSKAEQDAIIDRAIDEFNTDPPANVQAGVNDPINQAASAVAEDLQESAPHTASVLKEAVNESIQSTDAPPVRTAEELESLLLSSQQEREDMDEAASLRRIEDERQVAAAAQADTTSELAPIAQEQAALDLIETERNEAIAAEEDASPQRIESEYDNATQEEAINRIGQEYNETINAEENASLQGIEQERNDAVSQQQAEPMAYQESEAEALTEPSAAQVETSTQAPAATVEQPAAAQAPVAVASDQSTGATSTADASEAPATDLAPSPVDTTESSVVTTGEQTVRQPTPTAAESVAMPDAPQAQETLEQVDTAASEEPSVAPEEGAASDFITVLDREIADIPTWTPERRQSVIDWFEGGKQGDPPFGKKLVNRVLMEADVETQAKQRKWEEAQRARQERVVKSDLAARSRAKAKAHTVSDDGIAGAGQVTVSAAQHDPTDAELSRDEEYADAVRAGDLNIAQAMVDEAAKVEGHEAAMYDQNDNLIPLSVRFPDTNTTNFAIANETSELAQVSTEDVRQAGEMLRATQQGRRVVSSVILVRSVEDYNRRNPTNPILPNEVEAIGQAEGFYIPKDGRAVVLLDQLSPREGESAAEAIVRVAVHERVFHGGFQHLYETDAKFKARADRLSRRLPAEQAQAIKDRYANAGVPLSPMTLLEEWMAETRKSHAFDALTQQNSIFQEMLAMIRDFLNSIKGMFKESAFIDNEANLLLKQILNTQTSLIGAPTRPGGYDSINFAVRTSEWSQAEWHRQRETLKAQGVPSYLIDYQQFQGEQTDQAKMRQRVKPLIDDFRNNYWTGGIDADGYAIVNDENVTAFERLADGAGSPGWGARLQEDFQVRAAESWNPDLVGHKGDVYGGVAQMEMVIFAQSMLRAKHPLGPDAWRRMSRYSSSFMVADHLTASAAGRHLQLLGMASKANSRGLDMANAEKVRNEDIDKDISDQIGDENKDDIISAVEGVTEDDVAITPELSEADKDIRLAHEANRLVAEMELDEAAIWAQSLEDEGNKPMNWKEVLSKDGVEALVDLFFRGGESRANAVGPLVEGSDMIKRTIASLMNESLEALGITRAEGRKTPQGADRLVRELGLSEIRESKMDEVDEQMYKRINDMAKSNPELANMIRDQWEFTTSFMRNSGTSSATFRRIIHDVLKARREVAAAAAPQGVAPARSISSIRDLAVMDDAKMEEELRTLLGEIREHIIDASRMETIDGEVQVLHPAQTAESMQSIERIARSLINESRARTLKNAEEKQVRAAGIKGLINFLLDEPTQSQSDPAKLRELTRNWLVDAGFKPGEADKLVDKYTPALKFALQTAREKAVDKVLKRISTIKKPTQDAILQAVRVGMANPSAKITELLAKQLGYQQFTDDDLQRMADIDYRMRTASPSERAALSTDFKRLLAKRSPNMKLSEKVHRMFVYSVLSGFQTMSLGFTVPAYAAVVRTGSTAADLLASVAQGKMTKDDAVAAMRGNIRDWVEGYSNWVSDFKNHWKTDTMTMYHVDNVNEITGLEEELNRALESWRTGSGMTKVKAAMNIVATSTDIVRKVMNSTDGASARTFKYTLLRDAARKLLYAGNDTTKGMEMAEIGNLIAEAGKYGSEAVRRHLAERADMDLDLVRQIGVDASNQYLLDFIEKRLGKDASEQADRYATQESKYEIGTIKSEGGFKWDLPHFVAELTKNASSWASQRSPLVGKLLLGFIAIPVNLANRSLAFTPIGLARVGHRQARVNKGLSVDSFYENSMGTQLQMRQRWVEGISGSIAMLMMTALAYAGADDDEDTYTGIRITLAGPEDKGLREAWLKAGNRPNSISWVQNGKTKFSLNYQRGGPEVIKMPLIVIGALNDMKLSGKLSDGSVLDHIGAWAGASMTGGLDASSFFGLRNLAQTQELIAGHSASDKSIASTVAWAGTGFVPWSGAIKNISRAVNSPLDQSSVRSAIIAQTPVLNMTNSYPSLNFLGEQRSSQPRDLVGSLTNSASMLGLPFYAGNGKTSDRLYTLMIEKGKTPSMPRRSSIESKNGYISDRDWNRYMKARGAFIKSTMNRMFRELSEMDKASFEKAISDISAQGTREAKKTLRWE